MGDTCAGGFISNATRHPATPPTAPRRASGAPQGRPPLLRAGARVLEGVVIESLIQTGPGGDVYQARGPDGERLVVKAAVDPVAACRIAHEAVVLSSLDHAHVGVLRRHGPLRLRQRSGGTLEGAALAVDLVSGHTLGGALATRRLPIVTAIDWARQLCRALAHAHARGVVHRDVKASNVLVEPCGTTPLAPGGSRLVLVDFGIATLGGRGEGPQRGAGLLGSVHTVSPEMVRGEPVGPRADLYAVGVLLYRMIAGRYPFHAANPAEVVAAHLHQEIPGLGARHPDLRVPPGLEDVLLSCLSKSPAGRPPSAEALERVLAELMEIPEADWVEATGFEITLVPRDREPPAPRPTSPYLYLALAGALVSLAAMLGAVLLMV